METTSELFGHLESESAMPTYPTVSGSLSENTSDTNLLTIQVLPTPDS